MEEKVDDRFPESYFTNLMIERANIIKDHLHKSVHPLIIVANIGPTMAVFKFYDTTKEDDSLKLCMTLSNLGDLHDQICVLWQHVNFCCKNVALAVLVVNSMLIMLPYPHKVLLCDAMNQ